MAVSTKRIHRHRMPTGVLSAAVAADGSTGFLGTMDGVYQIDLESGRSEMLYQHDSYVSGVALVPDQPLLISAGYDGKLKWYDTQERLVVRHLTAHDFWSWAMAVSPDGQHIATVTGQYLAGSYEYEPAAEREPSVRIYRVHDGTFLSLSHVPSVQSVAFSPDSRFVAAGNLMGEVRVWNTETGAQLSKFKTDDFTSWGIIKSHHYLGGIFDLHFTPDGEHLLLTGMGQMRDPMAGNGKQMWQQYAWKSEAPEKLNEYKGGEGLMETLAFHPAGTYFVMAGRLRGGDWNAAVFNQAGENIHSLKTGCRITKALFIDGGSKLVLAGTQGQGAPKDGGFKSFGRFDVFEFSIA